jgi:hypothetical protein
MTDEQNVLSYYIIHKIEFSQMKLFMFMLQKTVFHFYLFLNYVRTHIVARCAITDLFCLFIS